jgi:hypothetical protein
VFDYEIRHHLSGETCILAKHLLEEKLVEQYEFSIIIGSTGPATSAADIAGCPSRGR